MEPATVAKARLFSMRNWETVANPQMNLMLAQAYFLGHDPKMNKRTWR
ncbi:MAG: hypothetical protein M2R45_01150 [Verrucomicrobia subdivision 3 bacterium]|nr:hypothetical protein [Limisphaerales bacterium]MCS1415296.1 hypothetical protein [Limisphaerales bacterium]